MYLYDGGDGLVAGWQDATALRARLQAANIAELLDARMPLVLSRLRLRRQADPQNADSHTS